MTHYLNRDALKILPLERRVNKLDVERDVVDPANYRVELSDEALQDVRTAANELRRARELCDEHDVLLVFDEIATGFGRTGLRFVAELVQPDIITLGKALTGGYIGHAVTVASKRVFDAFYDDSPESALMHGPTFMANPLACAAALKSIEIFERDDYLAKIKRIESIARRELADLNDPRVKEKRIMGGVACIEVHDPSTLTGYAQFARERGVFSRPFKNIVYTTPPYIIEEAELVQILGVMKDFFAVARNASR